VTADRTEARRALVDYLQHLEDNGHTPVCWQADPRTQAAWTSDDHTEQATAARACQDCPALTACREYGRTFPRERGVYGGVTERDRKKR
jgi:hypothetical protein